MSVDDAGYLCTAWLEIDLCGQCDSVRYYNTDGGGPTVSTDTRDIQFRGCYQAFGQGNGTPTDSGTFRSTGKPYSSAIGLYCDGAPEVSFFETLE